MNAQEPITATMLTIASLATIDRPAIHHPPTTGNKARRRKNRAARTARQRNRRG